MLSVCTLLYSQEDRRFISVRRIYNRIRKNSANVDGYCHDQAEVAKERTWEWIQGCEVQRGDIKEYNLVKAGLTATRARAEGLRNSQSGFIAALNPNERSFPPPMDLLATCFPSRMPYLRGYFHLKRDFQSSWEIREDFIAQITKADIFPVKFNAKSWFYYKYLSHCSKSRKEELRRFLHLWKILDRK